MLAGSSIGSTLNTALTYSLPKDLRLVREVNMVGVVDDSHILQDAQALERPGVYQFGDCHLL